MKNKNNLSTIILIALLCIGGTYWYLEVYNKKPVEPLPDPEPTILPVVVTITGEEIQSGINNIGELNTAEYYFTRVEEVNSVRQVDLNQIGIKIKFDIPGTANGFTYKYDGEIKAGIDFTKVTVEKNDDAKTITVKSPKATITNSNVDPDSYEFYVKDNNILNPIDPENYAISFADLIHSEEEKAVESGLLTKAEDNAKMMLENFVKNSYGCEDFTTEVVFED